MNIFDDIGKDIPELKNYLEYLFKIKKSRTVTTQEVLLNFDEFTAEIFIPSVKKTGQRLRLQQHWRQKKQSW